MAEPTALRTITNKAGVTEDLAKTTIFFASDWQGIKDWFAWLIELFTPRTGSTATTFSWDGTGTPGTSSSKTIKYQRIGDWVTMFIPAFSVTTGTGSSALQANTVIADAWARPNASLGTASVAIPSIRNNGASLGPAGVLWITSSGQIGMGRDNIGTVFSNNASAGIEQMVAFTFYAGS